MKRLRLLPVGCAFMIISIGCHRGNTIIVNNGDVSLEIKYLGKIQFTQDDSAIQSISYGGYLKYWENDNKLFAETNPQGQIVYEMYENGKRLAVNQEEGKAFLAKAIQEMISMGFDAKGRIQRIYKKGGSRAVLNEIEKMKVDYVKSIYFEFLLSNDTLSEQEITETAKLIASRIGSDYDKARLLEKFAALYLKNPQTSQVYLDAVKTLGSDYEKANALKKIIKNSITSDQFNQVLNVTRSLGADYEKANVLKELIGHGIFPGKSFDTLLDVSSQIGSDFEKENVLKDILKQPLASDQIVQMLSTTNGIGAEYEKENVLKELISHGNFAGDDFDKLLGTIGQMGSDFEKANLFKKIVEKNPPSEREWISLINATVHVTANFEKSNTLLEIAHKMPKSEQVKAAYMQVAKTMTEDAEYGKVVRAIE